MASTPRRVLVADDEEGIRFLWSNVLRKPPGAYEVVTVCDGCQALEVMSRQPVDLVVTDIWMPLMGGLELTEAIRQLGYQVPVIWFTAWGLPGIQADAERLNVYCCLYKPLQMSEMRQVVADALAPPRRKAMA